MAPILAELRRAHGERGLEVVAISDEPAAAQERAADALKLNLVLLRVEGAREVFPTVIVTGRDGAVRAHGRRAGARGAGEAVLPLLEAGTGRAPRLF